VSDAIGEELVIRRAAGADAGAIGRIYDEAAATGFATFATGPHPKGATGTYLNGISCPGPTACIAVGNYSSSQTLGAPLAVRLNGGKWSLVKLPQPGRSAATTLSGVSCTGAGKAAVCWAVGSYATEPEREPFYTVTEHTMGPEIVIMSRRAWEELSPDERAIFRGAARESSHRPPAETA